MRLLLHCCCGPCSLEVAAYFRSLGYQVDPWFFNPNIHPPEELARRESAMRQAIGGAASTASCQSNDERGAESGEEGLLCFLLRLARGEGRRCLACYRLRLEAAAQEAARRGCEAFSTTLTISPYQDQEAIRAAGEQAAAAAGVGLLYADLREHFHASADRARELGLYRQNYCGCLFSRLERAERRAGRAIRKALSRKAQGPG